MTNPKDVSLLQLQLDQVGHMAESIVGHPLPSAALRGGSLNAFRARTQAAHG